MIPVLISFQFFCIYTLILYGVLQLKNSHNESSTWQQMDPDYREQNNIEHPKNYKKK